MRNSPRPASSSSPLQRKPEQVVAAKKAGANNYIGKPFTAEALKPRSPPHSSLSAIRPEARSMRNRRSDPRARRYGLIVCVALAATLGWACGQRGRIFRQGCWRAPRRRRRR